MQEQDELRSANKAATKQLTREQVLAFITENETLRKIEGTACFNEGTALIANLARTCQSLYKN
jgi:hypothetical protein